MIFFVHQTITIGFFVFILYLNQLNSSENQFPFNHAETLFDEGLYQDAWIFYNKAYQSNPNSELSTFLIIRLAECQIELGNDQQALSLLSNFKSSCSIKEKNEIIYLTAIAHRHLRQYQQALNILKLYQENEQDQDLNQDILLEKGLNSFYLHFLTEAKIDLMLIKRSESKPHRYWIAQLYLIRLKLLNREVQQALQLVETLEKQLPNSHLLSYEIAFLHGMACFLSLDYPQAIVYFEKALPKQNEEKCDWYLDTLYYLASAYMALIDQPSLKKEDQKILLIKAEKALHSILLNSQEEKFYLALGELYLLKAQHLQNEQAYLEARQFLSQQEKFLSSDGKHQALLLQAAANPDYLEREYLYDQLAAKLIHTSPIFYARSWYLRGINHFEEALKLKDTNLNHEAIEIFNQAAQAFKRSYSLFEELDPMRAALSLKYQALSYYYQQTDSTTQQALAILRDLMDSKSNLLVAFQDNEEIYSLAALLMADLLPQKEDSSFTWIESVLKQRIQSSTNKEPDRSMHMLGILYFKGQQIEKADHMFSQLIENYPQSSYQTEAWFWKAKCAANKKETDQMKQYLQRIFQEKPSSPYAPQAYFNYYSYREYLQGHRKAIKHLQAMPTFFPNHPLLITAHYLIGLDYKKNHLSDKGEIQRFKNLTAAIDAFQETESLFDTLYAQNLIDPSRLYYFTQIRYRSVLERAKANLMIADSSQGSKQQIYLSYAEEVLNKIKDAFHDSHSFVHQVLFKEKTYPKLLEESEFRLAQIYNKQGLDNQVADLLEHMLNHYQQINQNKGYFLSHTWYEKGRLAQKQEQPALALNCFIQAEKTAQGLNPDEKLDIWIQQSLCHQALQELEEAMRVLSKVINDETISSLRLKAMFLRAEIYELQKRPELALKQLEATSKKGGEWGKKAQEKLEKNYGYE